MIPVTAKELDQLIKAKIAEGKMNFYAERLHWHEDPNVPESIGANNHIPKTQWVLVSSKRLDYPKDKILKEKQRILGFKKYYRTCFECNRTLPIGWFNSTQKLCDSCAEQSGDVVF